MADGFCPWAVATVIRPRLRSTIPAATRSCRHRLALVRVTPPVPARSISVIRSEHSMCGTPPASARCSPSSASNDAPISARCCALAHCVMAVSIGGECTPGVVVGDIAVGVRLPECAGEHRHHKGRGRRSTLRPSVGRTGVLGQCRLRVVLGEPQTRMPQRLNVRDARPSTPGRVPMDQLVNSKRLHASLNHTPPVEWEQQYLQAS